MAKQQHGGHTPIKGWGVPAKPIGTVKRNPLIQPRSEEEKKEFPLSETVKRAKKDPEYKSRIIPIENKLRVTRSALRQLKMIENEDKTDLYRSERDQTLADNTEGLTSKFLKKKKEGVASY